uniref:(California timema) hypothetical protein n=1 Tax=Timema californicum TaxID=61474 RepID=A0A7R9JAN0_TIMCA|nr:unnamed protein product [Timema californicum]
MNETGEDIPWRRGGENHVQHSMYIGSFVKRCFPRWCGGENHAQYSVATGYFLKRWHAGENHAQYSMATGPFVERSSFFNDVIPNRLPVWSRLRIQRSWARFSVVPDISVKQWVCNGVKLSLTRKIEEPLE